MNNGKTGSAFPMRPNADPAIIGMAQPDPAAARAVPSATGRSLGGGEGGRAASGYGGGGAVKREGDGGEATPVSVGQPQSMFTVVDPDLKNGGGGKGGGAGNDGSQNAGRNLGGGTRGGGGSLGGGSVSGGKSAGTGRGRL